MGAGEKLDLKTIANGGLSPKYISEITPLAGTDSYAQISPDGTKVVECSYKSADKRTVLLDADDTNGERISGIQGYVMSPNGKRMLIQTHTIPIYRRSFMAEFYVYDIATKTLSHLSNNGLQQVPTWSPDSRQVAFVRENNLFLVNLSPNGYEEEQVTTDGDFNKIINGVPDWVNEEEFSFNKAFTFTADGSRLCWVRYDESDVKTYSLQAFKGLNPALDEYGEYPGEYSYKYPKAGTTNSTVSVWSYDINSKQARQLQFPLDSDGYIPRIKPTKDANRIIVYTMNRHQDTLSLYSVDTKDGAARLILREKDIKYIKEENMDAIDVEGDCIIVPSDRDGYTHLYIYDLNGNMMRKVGNGNFNITDLYGMNKATGDVYYQAATPNEHERQVFVTHKNGKTDCLAARVGTNDAVFSADYKYFINRWSDYNTPYVYTISDSKGHETRALLDNKNQGIALSAFELAPRDTFTFITSEGVRLDGWMIKPSGFDASKKYPVILYQYGGPGSQQVLNSWSSGSMGNGGLYDYYLAQQGFIVVCVDGRGTGGRGADFEKCVYQKLGELEAKDQVETAIYIGSLPFVDKGNIGIWGWSYGGFNTLMSMSEGRGVFKAGVAVAPPTDWRYYDTIYTERYMRTPVENPSGYNDNPIARAGKLHGALLICHGTADDNVNPQNSFEYAEALVQADKDFKENYYTNRNHSIIGGNTRNHLLRQIADFFIQNLK